MSNLHNSLGYWHVLTLLMLMNRGIVHDVAYRMKSKLSIHLIYAALQ